MTRLAHLRIPAASVRTADAITLAPLESSPVRDRGRCGLDDRFLLRL